jgi:D-alanyl-D-alanine carboxypeptidase (penicillin-binding protein 5/6)
MNARGGGTIPPIEHTNRPRWLAISLVLLASLAAALAYGIWVIHVAQEAAKPPAAAQAYCTALQQKNYTRAYALLSPTSQAQISSGDFTLTAQLHDAIDGPITRCTAPQPGLAAGFTFDVGATHDALDMQIARNTLHRGAIALTKAGGDWRVDSVAASLAGTDVGPLVVENHFCAALVAQSYSSASAMMSDALRAQLPASALATTFGNSAATALASCQADLSTYHLSTADDAASVRVPFVVHPLGSSGAHPLTAPLALTFALQGTWKLSALELAPASIASLAPLTPPGQPTPPATALAAPAIQAAAAILLNPATNQVYFARNADDERAMASTTKIMTAVTALTFGQLNQRITVGSDATALQNGISSVAGLRYGDVLTLHDLLYALLLPSGDDAAVVIADGIAGSQASFVAMMNMEAQLLGLHHTHYSDVHGLDAPNHYTTARDLAMLAEYAMRFSAFTQTVATPRWIEPGYAPWDTTNLLLTTSAYPGVTGIKTGYTGQAGGCLVFSATHAGHPLLGVVLGDPGDNGDMARFTDAAALLTWGFALQH